MERKNLLYFLWAGSMWHLSVDIDTDDILHFSQAALWNMLPDTVVIWHVWLTAFRVILKLFSLRACQHIQHVGFAAACYVNLQLTLTLHCRRRWGYDTTTRRMCCAPFNDWTGSGRHVRSAPAYAITRQTLQAPQLLRTLRSTYLPFPSTTNSFWFHCRTLLILPLQLARH